MQRFDSVNILLSIFTNVRVRTNIECDPYAVGLSCSRAIESYILYAHFLVNAYRFVAKQKQIYEYFHNCFMPKAFISLSTHNNRDFDVKRMDSLCFAKRDE